MSCHLQSNLACILWWNSARKNKEAVITSNGFLTFRIPSGIIITSVYPYWCISALPASTVVPALLDVTYDLCQASVPCCAALVAAHFHMDGYPVVSGTAPRPCWIPGPFYTRLQGMFRGMRNCEDGNQLLVIEFCCISQLTWLTSVPKHIYIHLFTQAHISG